MTKLDLHGNQYRQTADGWQVMRQGIGWSPVNNEHKLTLVDGTTIPPQTGKKDMTEAEKSFVLSHSRDLHLQAFAVMASSGASIESKDLAGNALLNAKALAEELKKEGVL